MIEVELKARLVDRADVQATVASFARYAGPVDKYDAYWHEPDWRSRRGAGGFRIRREEGASVVTFKQKRVEGGLEVNLENEFGVTDPEVFVEFCRRLGCEPFFTKRKSGSRYLVGPGLDEGYGLPATIEIVEVAGLGDFIEIEILLEDEAALPEARAELRALLERSGVPASEIEDRFYSELLAAAGLIPPP